MLAAAEIISLALGYENLIENRKQSAENNVQKANDEQARYLLSKLDEKFNLQNEMLGDILHELRRLNYYLERSTYHA